LVYRLKRNNFRNQITLFAAKKKAGSSCKVEGKRWRIVIFSHPSSDYENTSSSALHSWPKRKTLNGAHSYNTPSFPENLW